MTPVVLASVVGHGCDVEPYLPVGPASVSLWDGNLGLAHHACPRTEVGLAPRALLLVDTPAFYGQVVASAGLEGSVAPDERTELWLRLEPVRYQNVISAIPASFLGYGSTTVGASRQVRKGRDGVTALQGQLVLPSAIGLQGRALPFALDLGLAGERQLSDNLRAHGRVGGAASASFSRGPAQPRAALLGTGGVAWAPSGVFSLVLDAQASLGYTAPLDHVALVPGVRFAVKRVGFELAGAVPLAGRERALAAVELHSSVRF